MSEACCSAFANALLFPCAGGSNVGQIANEAAIKLEQRGIGRLYCLAGIGGHVESMVKHTQSAPCTIAIDGCEVCCARKTLEHAGIAPTVHVVLTELGIVKQRVFDYPEEQVQQVVDAVLEGPSNLAADASQGSCCSPESAPGAGECCKP